MEAGRSAFAERGDSRAIIREIARRAGVARGLHAVKGDAA
ncbi:TetR family transcriptional regulator [Streptomyces flaveus]